LRANRQNEEQRAAENECCNWSDNAAASHVFARDNSTRR
jgi:hypothetical protein